jgi:hypothetical protein
MFSSCFSVASNVAVLRTSGIESDRALTVICVATTQRMAGGIVLNGSTIVYWGVGTSSESRKRKR